MLPHSARKITHQNPANPACRDIHRSVASGDREHPRPIKSAKLQVEGRQLENDTSYILYEA